jgi:hypothetical protein
VCHRTVSGAPLDSVQCTRENHSELLSFGNSGSYSAIIQRTVQCSTGLSGVAPNCPVYQRSNSYTAPTVGKKKKVKSRSSTKYATSSDEENSSDGEENLLTLFANLNMQQKEKLNELISAIHEKDELLDSQEDFLIKGIPFTHQVASERREEKENEEGGLLRD